MRLMRTRHHCFQSTGNALLAYFASNGRGARKAHRRSIASFSTGAFAPNLFGWSPESRRHYQNEVYINRKQGRPNFTEDDQMRAFPCSTILAFEISHLRAACWPN